MIRLLLFAALTVSVAGVGPVQVTDGDTLKVGRESIRVVGIDAPELRGRCMSETLAAYAARDRMAYLLASAKRVEIIRRKGRDKYRRTLARVLIDGRDVADVLIGDGVVRPYDGGKRGGWC
jgi:micrococcal nuclease